MRLERRLRVELLEDRVVPTVGFIPTFTGTEITSGQGTAYTTADIYVIFEGGPGSYWTTTQGKADATTLTADIKTIISSTYLQGISQYAQTGAISSVVQDTYETAYTDTTDALPTNFMNHNSWTDLDNLLTDAQNNASSGIPGPSSTVENFYIFVTDPKVASGDAGVTGLNKLVPDAGFGFPPPPATPYNEIWVNTPLNSAGTAINMNLETQYLSEQLADTQSGDVKVQFGNAVSAWQSNDPNKTANKVTAQIADGKAAMMPYTYALDGVTVTAYWSQQDQEFIVPNGSSQWTFPGTTVITTVSNSELLSNGVVLEKSAINGSWLVALEGIQDIAQGAAGSTWANTIYALNDYGDLYSATVGTGVYTKIYINVTQFAFGNKGTVYSNDAFILFNSYVGFNFDYATAPGKSLTLLDDNIQSFQLGPVSSTWANWLFDLHYGNGTTSNFLDYTLYAADANLTFYKMDNHVASFAFGANGSSWEDYLVDLHNNFDPVNPDTLWATTSPSTFFSTKGANLSKFESAVAGFSFGNAGSTFDDSFVIYFLSGTLDYFATGGKLTTIDTGVTSYSFGLYKTSWTSTLFWTDGNGDWESTSPTGKSTKVLASAGGGGIAFGLVGTGNWGTVYFLDGEGGSLYDTQVTGTSGPGTGLLPIYSLNTSLSGETAAEAEATLEGIGWFGAVPLDNDSTVFQFIDWISGIEYMN